MRPSLQQPIELPSRREQTDVNQINHTHTSNAFFCSFSITFPELKNTYILLLSSLSLCYIFLSSMTASFNILI